MWDHSKERHATVAERKRSPAKILLAWRIFTRGHRFPVDPETADGFARKRQTDLPGKFAAAISGTILVPSGSSSTSLRLYYSQA